MLCRVGVLLRGREAVLAWEAKQELKKILKKNTNIAEQRASHSLQSVKLWVWERLAALGYIQSKGRYIIPLPHCGGKLRHYFVVKYPFW